MSCPFDLHVRSYAVETGVARHDFAQLVLPLSGQLLVDLEGREDRLDPAGVLFVAPGAGHNTLGLQGDRSFVLDLAPDALGDDTLQALARRPFLRRSEAVARLVDYMRVLIDGGRRSQALLPMWTPLLLDALADAPVQPWSRLQGLMACVEAEPGLDWSNARMAARAAMSVSRLHALFAAHLQCTPQAWLSQVRMRHARQWLLGSALPVSEIAQRCGYADQAALTRAMRRLDGVTPAALRRSALVEPGTRIQ